MKFAVIGDSGTGERPQYQVAEQMAPVPRRFPIRSRDHAGRQHLRRSRRLGPRQEIRTAVQGTARRRRDVLCVARQSRQPKQPRISALPHGRSRATPRSRRRMSGSSRSTPTAGSRASRLARRRAQERETETVEDLLLPPSALFGRRHSRIGHQLARRARAPLCHATA